MDCAYDIADSKINALFDVLVASGWLTSDEVCNFAQDNAVKKVIKESTSPILDNVFNAFNLTNYNDVKVLILGQDPYPNPMHAHGLAFSSRNTTTPGSLRNIFKAIDAVYESNLVLNKNNDLTNWAKSGVLLLNTSLTYRSVDVNVVGLKTNNSQNKEKKFHLKTWEPFIDLIIAKLLNRNKKLVMFLWGGDALNIVMKNIKRQNLSIEETENGKILLPQNNVLILYTDHPSQVKINLGGKFLEHAPLHFKECDNILGNDKIDWVSL